MHVGVQSTAPGIHFLGTHGQAHEGLGQRFWELKEEEDEDEEKEKEARTNTEDGRKGERVTKKKKGTISL